MPDSDPVPPAGNSARPKTAMENTQSGNLNTNGGEAKQNPARAGSSGMAGAGQPHTSATPSKAMVKYGELVILGYNGQLPQGSKLFVFIIAMYTSAKFFTLE